MTEQLVLEPAPAEDVAKAVAQLGLTQPLVVALPPGGMALAAAISRLLDAPLDLLVMRPDAEAYAPAQAAAAAPLLRGRSVVLVDDGQADAATWQVAIDALLRMAPARLVIAVPWLPLRSVPLSA